MHGVEGGCHSTRPALVLAKPAADCVVFPIHPNTNKKLTFVPILGLQGEKETEMPTLTPAVQHSCTEGAQQKTAMTKALVPPQTLAAQGKRLTTNKHLMRTISRSAAEREMEEPGRRSFCESRGPDLLR